MSAGSIERDALLVLISCVRQGLSSLPADLRQHEDAALMRSEIKRALAVLSRGDDPGSFYRACVILEIGMSRLRARGYTPREIANYAFVANLRPNSIPHGALNALADMLEFAVIYAADGLCTYQGRPLRSAAAQAARAIFFEAEEAIGSEVLNDWSALLERLATIGNALHELGKQHVSLISLGMRRRYASRVRRERGARRLRSMLSGP